MRILLLLATVSALLSGCTASTPSPETATATTPELALPDVDVQETHELLRLGLPETTWSFDVARGASGHVVLMLRGAAPGDSMVGGEVCLDYDIPPGAAMQSSRSTCGGPNVNVAVSVITTDQSILEVRGLAAGHYRITASAPVQANELHVDIQVDNP